MTIRFRLIIIYLFIEAVLLTIFCVIIYFQSENHRQTESKNRLNQEALTASTIFFQKNEISPEILKLLDKNNFTALIDEEIIIYDDKNHIIYESGQENLIFNQENLKKVKEFNSYFWKEKQRELFGIKIIQQHKEYLVISSAIDKYGLSKQKNLAFMLLFGGLLILFLSSIAAWIYVKKMLQPINQIIYKIDSIKSSELSVRLDEGNKNDEFAQLAIRFNQMLERLQNAFISQRSFVSNASHELRTPLTSITGQIQVSLLAKDSPKDLKLMITSVLEDVQQLNILSNNLLDLTSLDIDNQERTLVNIVDKILRVRNDVLIKNPDSTIDVKFEYDEELIPELYGNAQLLFTAFLNLVENGVKYSNKHSLSIDIKVDKSEIRLVFQNKSDLITDNELQTIFNPFVRGSNVKQIKGHGVGLSLTKKIIDLHNGDITIKFTQLEGFCVAVSLPRKL